MADAVCLSGAGDGRSYLARTQLSLSPTHIPILTMEPTQNALPLSDYTIRPDFISEMKSKRYMRGSDVNQGQHGRHIWIESARGEPRAVRQEYYVELKLHSNKRR